MRSYRPQSGRPQRSFSSRPRRQNRSAGIDPRLFVNKNVVSVKQEVYKPQHTFDDFAIDNRLKANIKKKGYIAPTAIQDKTIPSALQGRDVVGLANTGTGKTAAFLIPLIDKILKNRNENILIMTPTRELALQIHEEFQAFTKGFGMNAAVCIGGLSIVNQIAQIRRNPNVVIGTPGRLKDLIQQEHIDFYQCHSVVLDEVDQMLDMGFLPDMRFLMGRLPPKRQSLFFSATMPEVIKNLIQEFLHNPVSVSVKVQDTAAGIHQDVIRVSRDQKIEKLHELLIQAEFQKVLIFGRTKYGVEKLSVALGKRGFKAASIHGDKTQSKRQQALKLFKQDLIQILVATDVAARGLDIDDVSHVINYDLPQSYEDYVHRIGRTGRADKTGIALTFIE
jgi:superfamily II DNA/RNA helicase